MKCYSQILANSKIKVLYFGHRLNQIFFLYNPKSAHFLYHLKNIFKTYEKLNVVYN